MRRDYSGESLSGRSARGAIDQIGYALSLFALVPAKGESVFCSRSDASSRQSMSSLRTFWPGPEPLHGRFWATEKQELSSVISVPSVVKTKSSFFSVFLAEAGWLRYPQERAGRALASMADS